MAYSVQDIPVSVPHGLQSRCSITLTFSLMNRKFMPFCGEISHSIGRQQTSTSLADIKTSSYRFTSLRLRGGCLRLRSYSPALSRGFPIRLLRRMALLLSHPLGTRVRTMRLSRAFGATGGSTQRRHKVAFATCSPPKFIVGMYIFQFAI